MVPFLAQRLDQHVIRAAAAERRENSGQFGCWLNTLGYDLRKLRDEKWLWTTKAIYGVWLPVFQPLTYVDKIGRQWRPRNYFETDMGSIPLTAQVLVPKDRGLLSYLLHDDACACGRLFCSVDGGPWAPEKLTRKERDCLLRDCLRAEGVNAVQAAAVYLAVRCWAMVSRQSR
jgi:hypothetical protein